MSSPSEKKVSIAAEKAASEVPSKAESAESPMAILETSHNELSIAIGSVEHQSNAFLNATYGVGKLRGFAFFAAANDTKVVSLKEIQENIDQLIKITNDLKNCEKILQITTESAVKEMTSNVLNIASKPKKKQKSKDVKETTIPNYASVMGKKAQVSAKRLPSLVEINGLFWLKYKNDTYTIGDVQVVDRYDKYSHKVRPCEAYYDHDAETCGHYHDPSVHKSADTGTRGFRINRVQELIMRLLTVGRSRHDLTKGDIRDLIQVAGFIIIRALKLRPAHTLHISEL